MSNQAVTPKWFFNKEELENTPSRADGIDSVTETRYRREGATLLKDIGQNMARPMNYLAIASASVFFHRFYMYQSFKDFEKRSMVNACLLLGGKVEESHRKCFDILEKSYYYSQLARLEKKARENPDLVMSDKDRQIKKLQKDSPQYFEMKEELLINERILLNTIAFDLSITHPFAFVIRYKNMLNLSKATAQKAWNFVNDSFRTTLCLQRKPDVMMAAMIYMASIQSNVTFKSGPNGEPWWHILVGSEVTMEDLEDIRAQMMDIYEMKPSPHSSSSSLTANPLSSTSLPPASAVSIASGGINSVYDASNPTSSINSTPASTQ